MQEVARRAVRESVADADPDLDEIAGRSVAARSVSS